ncbi:hypothetical protein ARMGADRAFT_1089096 [Armillaria gallica]|uniref:Uncharacterized protein n=1 Tax=Armillaria gallica TaxID=47427 RepID=A0A2H3D5Q7_ARMGA|nr:hypothetical protein ARMGADRAFT_1089096 [Armillaria gallica]
MPAPNAIESSSLQPLTIHMYLCFLQTVTDNILSGTMTKFFIVAAHSDFVHWNTNCTHRSSGLPEPPPANHAMHSSESEQYPGGQIISMPRPQSPQDSQAIQNQRSVAGIQFISLMLIDGMCGSLVNLLRSPLIVSGWPWAIVSQ